MDETPFPEGAEPQQPTYQQPNFQPPTPYTPGASSRPAGRPRRWMYLIGAALAVAVLLALGVAAGMAITGARAAGGSSPSTFFHQFGRGHDGDGAGFGRGDHGAMGLTVTKVSGQTITATNRDNSAVTIHITASTTYTRAGKAVSLSAVTAGEHIAVMGTRNSDGSIAATRVTIILPGYRGVVSAVNGSAITITDRQGAHTIKVSSATAYTTDAGVASSLSAIAKGAEIEAEGSLNADGSLNAEVVRIETPRAAGKVTAVTATSITVSGPRGSQVIHLSASTAYDTVTMGQSGPTRTATTLSAVKVGVFVMAEGALNSDGSLNAQTVLIATATPGGPWDGPHGAGQVQD
ncbi:MAG TPA: DUF5666 domain-containing protein [Ktedonobacterales bacterium]